MDEPRPPAPSPTPGPAAVSPGADQSSRRDPSSRRTPGSPPAAESTAAPGWPLWASAQRAGELAAQEQQQSVALTESQEFSTLALTSPCPECARPVRPDERYCENCGADVNPQVAGAGAAGVASEATVKLNRPGAAPRVCLECGGEVDVDGYCQTCGAKAPTPRDHFEAAPADWVGGVCDRGVVHPRNEDAMALWVAEPPERVAVLVVCDGVSSSQDSDVAALAAAETARDVLVALRPTGLGTLDSHDAAMDVALVEAAARANDAVIERTAADSVDAASCTFAAAVVHEERIHWAAIGDSRIYFVAEGAQVQLSTDHSAAEELIRAGSTRAEAEASPQAHGITRWLGRDSDDVVPDTGTYTATEDGWLVLCSDGLWNYASDPTAIAAVVAEASAEGGSPTQLAARLVRWANAQGGKDNVTVVLARLTATLNSAPQAPSGSPAGRSEASVAVPNVEGKI